MTPAEIAARLTPAQKRALLWLPGDGEPRTRRNWREIVPRRDVLWRLCELGLAAEWESQQARPLFAYSLTDFGQAVRAIVEQEQQP